MASQICPECGAVIQATDTHCMECGTDVVKARRELAEKEKRERGAPAIDPNKAAVVQGARGGMAAPGESVEKVRLKTFDKQLADKLTKERVAVILTAAMALAIGLVILFVGLKTLMGAGGLAAVRDLSYVGLREQGFGAFANMSFTGSAVTLLGIAGLLCAVGQSIRVVTATQAIAAVRRSERPDVVCISLWTKGGLLLASLLVAPFGIVLGIIFKMGEDEETQWLGGTMIKAGILSLAFIGVNLIWNLLADVASRPAPPPGANAASG
jgi:hypothetical protein